MWKEWYIICFTKECPHCNNPIVCPLYKSKVTVWLSAMKIYRAIGHVDMEKSSQKLDSKWWTDVTRYHIQVKQHLTGSYVRWVTASCHLLPYTDQATLSRVVCEKGGSLTSIIAIFRLSNTGAAHLWNGRPLDVRHCHIQAKQHWSCPSVEWTTAWH
jgi:hypothetical protein